MKDDKEKKSGPTPEELQIEGDWEEVMKKALGKERPPEGWPMPKNSETYQCLHELCGAYVMIPIEDRTEGRIITCGNCGRQYKLIRASMLGAQPPKEATRVWDLKPITKDD